jgi:hypothetical protein
MKRNLKVYDSSNATHVAEAEKNEEDKEKDILFILNEPRGRRWVYSLIHSQCHILSISHVPLDKESTAFNEGARSVGIALEEVVRERAPILYMKMLEENHFNG